MCDFEQMLAPPGSGAAEAALEQSRYDANQALLAQQQAIDQAAAAADTQSESAQLAKEGRMRKLLAAGAFGATLPSDNLGAAPVATRQLYGG